MSFHDFWPSFNPQESLFFRLLETRSRTSVKIIKDSKQADLSFFSAFPFSNRWNKLLRYGIGLASNRFWWDYIERSDYGFSLESMKRAKRVIWYTPENLRPPVSRQIYTISFNETEEGIRNLYFPFLFWRIDWGLNTQESIRGVTPDFLVEPRQLIDRPTTSCAFSRSREPSRMRIFDSVSKVMPLDVYGQAVNRHVDNKFRTSEMYGYQVCPENSLYPGYVTEKVLEAWVSGNLAIWQGFDRHQLINTNAIIDVTQMSSEQVQNTLIEISQDEAAWKRSQPLLNALPTIEPLYKFMEEALGCTLPNT